MAVHAHPDDESITTGGTLARCAAEGVTTCLVTCTDGRYGPVNPELGLTLSPDGLASARALSCRRCRSAWRRGSAAAWLPRLRDDGISGEQGCSFVLVPAR